MSSPTPATVELPLGLRARKKARTRDAIAAAALALFLERGVDGTTVEDIAAAADVSPRTFFRYFASKDDVVFAGFPDQIDRLLAMLRSRPADEPVFTSLRVAARQVVTEAELSAPEPRALLRLIHHHPGLHASYLRWLEGVEAQVAAWAADRLGQDPHDLRPRLLAAAALTARRVATDRWLDSGGSEDLGGLLDEALAQLAAGLD
jgi:AcrR family transcriptional regulator